MIDYDLAFYAARLADMERVLSDPDIAPGLRKTCEHSRDYCKKKIMILEFYAWKRGVIAQN